MGGTREALIALPCFALALFIYWKGVKRLVARGLPGIRYWLPTAMVAAGFAAMLPSGWSATIGVFVNGPAVLGGGLANLLLTGAGISGWPLGIGVAAAAWAAWYLLIRIVEERMEEQGPVMIKLS